MKRPVNVSKGVPGRTGTMETGNTGSKTHQSNIQVSGFEWNQLMISMPKVFTSSFRALRSHELPLHSQSMGPLVYASLRSAQNRRPLDVVGPTTCSWRGVTRILSSTCASTVSEMILLAGESYYNSISFKWSIFGNMHVSFLPASRIENWQRRVLFLSENER